MNNASAVKDERRAVETLLALKCVDAGKLPEWAWMRAVAACLRRHTYDFDPPPRRRRYVLSGHAYGVKDLRDNVRGELGIERLPPGMGKKIEAWGHEWIEKVSTRQKAAVRRDALAVRHETTWNGVRWRVEAALARWGFEKRLARAGGATTYAAVSTRSSDMNYPLGVGILATPIVENHSAIRPDTGQVNIDVNVTCAVGRAWYGRVYKRGIAIVGDCFIVDVVGYGPAVGGGECLIVDCAAPGVGFQVKPQKRAVHLTKTGARFLTAEEEGQLRAGPWFEYANMKKEEQG